MSVSRYPVRDFVPSCEALRVDPAQLLLALGLGRGRVAGTRLLLPGASEGRDRVLGSSVGTGPSRWVGEVRRKSATGPRAAISGGLVK